MTKLTAEEAQRFPEYAKACELMEDNGHLWIGDTITHLKENGYVVAEYREDEDGIERLVPAYKTTEELVAEVMGIDHNAYTRERDIYVNELLDEIRASAL